jgi:hypothetical protein
MNMLSFCRTSRSTLRRFAVTTAALALAGACSLPAMAATSPAAGDSSSSITNYQGYFNVNDLAGNSLVSAPEPEASAVAQYGGYGNRYPNYQSRWSHFAFEGGAGMTAPIGNDTHGYETYGYNITVGAGWNFTKRFGALIEYQFDRNKIPGRTLAKVGVQGGNINTWSFTIDPIYYLPVTHSFGAYVTGGGGFYRKVTNFTDLQQGVNCYYFCYYGYFPATVAHFSSNQGGLNAGIGFYWKAFGPDSNAKLYIESRYVWVDSPKPTPTQQGEGTEGLIPLTIGLRF